MQYYALGQICVLRHIFAVRYVTKNLEIQLSPQECLWTFLPKQMFVKGTNIILHEVMRSNFQILIKLHRVFVGSARVWKHVSQICALRHKSDPKFLGAWLSQILGSGLKIFVFWSCLMGITVMHECCVLWQW